MTKTQWIRLALPLVLGAGLAAALLAIPGDGRAQPAAATASDPLVGRPITISALTINERAPVVAYDGARREFLVVWQNLRPSADDDIYAQRVGLNGQLLSWFNVDFGAVITGDRTSPGVAYNSQRGDYLVVYACQVGGGSRWDVMGRRVDIYGPQGAEFTIATSTTIPGGNENAPVVAYNSQDDEYLVVWVEGSLDTELWGRRVAGQAGGGQGGSEFENDAQQLAAFASTAYRSPDLAYHPGRNEYLMVYDASDPSAEVQARVIGASGVYTAGNQVRLLAGEQAAVAVNADADEYAIVYKYMGASPVEIWRCELGGGLVGVVNSRLTAPPANDQTDPDIARLGDSDLHQVVWSEQFSTGRAIMGARLDTDGNTEVFDVHRVAGDYEALATVAGASPVTLVVWEHDGASDDDVYGRLVGWQVYLPLVTRQ